MTAGSTRWHPPPTALTVLMVASSTASNPRGPGPQTPDGISLWWGSVSEPKVENVIALLGLRPGLQSLIVLAANAATPIPYPDLLQGWLQSPKPSPTCFFYQLSHSTNDENQK
jgi:hypothetical protein